jgi:hypothetical protein
VQVVDKREIWFDSAALVYCLRVSPRAAEGFGLPSISPNEVRFFPKEKAIDVVYGKVGAMGAARSAAESLGALLVSYCIRAKIPMPRIADKSIRVEAEGIVLEFITRFDKAPTPETADSSARASQAVKNWKWV